MPKERMFTTRKSSEEKKFETAARVVSTLKGSETRMSNPKIAQSMSRSLPESPYQLEVWLKSLTQGQRERIGLVAEKASCPARTRMRRTTNVGRWHM